MPSLEVTTIIGCPMKCTFCPQDKLIAGYSSPVRSLSLEDFAKILSKVPTYVRIDFSGMAEPWSNRQATDMLELALVSGFNVAVYTTLQGMRDHSRVISLLTRYKEQVEAVVLHLPDKNGNMRGFKRSEVYDLALAAFTAFGQQKIVRHFATMTMDRGNETALGVAPSAKWTGLSRAGNVNTDLIAQQPIEPPLNHATPLTCSFTPFYDHNVLLPNGDVVLCCMDYSLKHRIGNLLTGDYFSLFSSHEMTALRTDNMRYGGDSICRKCSRANTMDVTPTVRQFWKTA
jgi:organic radical activating enzyme